MRWSQRDPEPPARTLEDFRARAARDPRVEPHTYSTGEQFGVMGVLLATGGIFFLISLLPGMAWLFEYGRLTLPVPLLGAMWAFMGWRNSVAERRPAPSQASGTPTGHPGPPARVRPAQPRPGRRRAVGYNPSLAVFCACAVLGAFVFAWAFLATPPNDASNLLNVLPPVCLGVTAFYLLGTCRLVVDPAGFIDVVDPLVVRRVPVAELVQAEHDEGLQLRLVSGRRVGSVAYGRSAIGEVMNYPRSARAAHYIEEAIGGYQATAQWPRPRDTVTSMPRIRAVLVSLAINALLVLGTVALNIVQTAAQR